MTGYYLAMLKDRLCVVLPEDTGLKSLESWHEEDGVFYIDLKDGEGVAGTPDNSGGHRYEFQYKSRGIKTKIRFARTPAVVLGGEVPGVISLGTSEDLKPYKTRVHRVRHPAKSRPKHDPAMVEPTVHLPLPEPVTPLPTPVKKSPGLIECVDRINLAKEILGDRLILGIEQDGSLSYRLI